MMAVYGILILGLVTLMALTVLFRAYLLLRAFAVSTKLVPVTMGYSRQLYELGVLDGKCGPQGVDLQCTRGRYSGSLPSANAMMVRQPYYLKEKRVDSEFKAMREIYHSDKSCFYWLCVEQLSDSFYGLELKMSSEGTC